VRIGEPLPFTVADGTGIEKGSLCALTDPRTASAVGAATEDQIIAGVLAREKVASDGRTQSAVFRNGWFEATSSGVIFIGDRLVSAGGNTVQRANNASFSGTAFLGTSLEETTDGERFLMELDIQASGGVGNG